MTNAQFELDMEVRDYELDCQGIVNNSVYQNYLEHTRHKFLLAQGLSFDGLHRDGIDAVVSKVEISYKASLRANDAFVSQLRVSKEGVKFVFHQDILRLFDRKLCVRGRIESVCVVDGRLSHGEMLDFLLPDE